MQLKLRAISAVAKRTAVQNSKNSTVDVDFKDADCMRPVFKFYKYENGEVAVRRECLTQVLELCIII